VLANDSDPDGDPLTLTSATVAPAEGTVTVNADSTLRFIPGPDFNGPATISYSITDGNGGTASAVATVNVTRGERRAHSDERHRGHTRRPPRSWSRCLRMILIRKGTRSP
jgi:hypothetical protein